MNEHWLFEKAHVKLNKNSFANTCNHLPSVSGLVVKSIVAMVQNRWAPRSIRG
jgi:hypothetical protein